MPPIDITDLRPTIVPKSDQLNAEQLLGGSMTLTVTGVQVSSSPEQPVVVHYEGDAGRPFKPCKTMRKLLVFAWGPDGSQWAGRSMIVYNDPSVKFGGDEVGGIRISHLSHIPKAIEVSLTSTRGKKALYRVALLENEDAKALTAIRAAQTQEALKDVFGKAWKAIRSDVRRATLKQAYDQRHAELQKPATTSDDEPPLGDTPAVTADSIASRMDAATTEDALNEAAALISLLAAEADRKTLNAKYDERLEAIRA